MGPYSLRQETFAAGPPHVARGLTCHDVLVSIRDRRIGRLQRRLEDMEDLRKHGQSSTTLDN